MSTVADLEPETTRSLNQRRGLYTVTTVVLSVIMGLGIIDAVGWLDVYGVDTASVRSSGGGYGLQVDYPSVTRPALASPFEITVTRDGGFDGPITVAVSRSYLKIWDENGVVPAPSSEITEGDVVQWEFDPPEGDVLTIYYDARIEPAVQSGQDGSVAVLDDGQSVVQVEFRTEVRP